MEYEYEYKYEYECENEYENGKWNINMKYTCILILFWLLFGKMKWNEEMKWEDEY